MVTLWLEMSGPGVLLTTLGQFFDKFCFVNKTKLIENHCRQQDDNCLTTGPRLISFFNPKLSTQSGLGTTIQRIFFGLTDEMGVYNFENKVMAGRTIRN